MYVSCKRLLKSLKMNFYIVKFKSVSVIINMYTSLSVIIDYGFNNIRFCSNV